MAIATTPPYTPTPPSISPRTEDGRNIVDWVMRELSKLSVNEGAQPRTQMTPISAPPITPREGLIAYADGISWNPNGVGKGIRLFDNTANPWRAMGAPFGGAGANHIMGLVPDPGAVVNNPAHFLGDDALFHAITTATLGAIPDPGAWTAYTPTITSSTGAFTSVSATGAFAQLGKTVVFRVSVSITTNGTAAIAVIATLPITAKAARCGHFSGREDAVSGKALAAWNENTTQAFMQNYDSTYPGANGAQINIGGLYESA